MPKIIIAEDDLMISDIYKKKFEESGFDVITAESGDQVLTALSKEKPDILLLDLLMPRMSGFEVIKTIRTKYAHLPIKIIVSSNLSQSEDRDRAIKLGAEGFLVKSEFTPSNLVKEVCRITNQLEEEKKNIEKLNSKNTSSSSEISEEISEKNILLIEDEEVFLEMFGDKLRQDGFNVVAASNGVAGLKEALQGEYDLFIIDMVMPGMGGGEIVEKLKMEEKTKDIPIIVFSASVDETAAKEVEKMGISAFFVKTQLVPSDLSKKVSEILM